MEEGLVLGLEEQEGLNRCRGKGRTYQGKRRVRIQETKTRLQENWHRCTHAWDLGGSLQRASLTPVKVRIRGGGNKLGTVSISWVLRARLNQQTSYTHPSPQPHEHAVAQEGEISPLVLITTRYGLFPVSYSTPPQFSCPRFVENQVKACLQNQRNLLQVCEPVHAQTALRGSPAVSAAADTPVRTHVAVARATKGCGCRRQ